jgi:hypothetical protein
MDFVRKAICDFWTMRSDARCPIMGRLSREWKVTVEFPARSLWARRACRSGRGGRLSSVQLVLRKAEDIRRYSISALGAHGWQVTLERDGEVSHVRYEDWPRVERALALFKREASELFEHGCQKIPSPTPGFYTIILSVPASVDS